MAYIWYAPEHEGATEAGSLHAPFMHEHAEVIGGGEASATAFTYRSARSGSLFAGLGIALLVETVVLHLWIVGRHPLLAWLLTAGSFGTLAWLVANYVAMGRGAIRLDEHALAIVVGRHFLLHVPRDRIAAVMHPDWRDIPEGGTPAAADFVSPMKPAAPNVLITLVEPMRARVAGGLPRTVRRIGLHVDEPQRLIQALGE